MRHRTWIDPSLPFGRFIASPLTNDSIATLGLYLLHRHVDELEGVRLAPADRHWLLRATAASFNACSVHPWDAYAFDAHSQAGALHALESVRRELLRQAGLTEQEEPHRWQADALSMVTAMPRQRRRAAAAGRLPRNVILGPWPDPVRPSSQHGRGPRGGK